MTKCILSHEPCPFGGGVDDFGSVFGHDVCNEYKTTIYVYSDDERNERETRTGHRPKYHVD